MESATRLLRTAARGYSALQTGRQDIAFIWEVAKTIAETTKHAAPQLVLVETSTNVNDHVIVNFRRPLFKDPRIWKAVNLAVDRKGYIQAGRQGAAIIGGILL